MKILALHTLAFLHVHRRSLLTFYLFFTGLTIAALTPLFSGGLAALRPVTGQAAISTGGLVQFVMSPGGSSGLPLPPPLPRCWSFCNRRA